MVGVPKSTGCLICRKRKIKCDETWPTCLNCQKNGKCCPGPPSRHTFKDSKPARSPEGSTDSQDRKTPPDPRSRRLTQLHERFAENGSVVHKFRISHNTASSSRKPTSRSASASTASASPPVSPFLRQPSPSQTHELARALVVATTTGSAGHRLSAFGPFIQEVPARIGHNPALDASVAVLVYAHTSLLHQKLANGIVNPTLYIRAIKTLQQSLEDPELGFSINTLCASVILSLVEALAGPRMANRYLIHVGGAGRLMELQGPDKYQDPFAKELLRFIRGGIIVTSVYARNPCFLTTPKWIDIVFDRNGLSFDECLHVDLLQTFAAIPALLKELEQTTSPQTPGSDSEPIQGDTTDYVGNMQETEDAPSDRCPSLVFSADSYDDHDLISDTHSIAHSTTHSTAPTSAPSYTLSSPPVYRPVRLDLLAKAQGLRNAFCALGVHLNNKRNDGVTIVELPSMDRSNPFSTRYHFNSWRDNVAYSTFWALCILTNRVIMQLLPPFDSAIFSLELENRALAIEICKTWEGAWQSKPIGTLHTSLSFVMAYDYCTPDVQEWMLHSLNSLLDYQMVDNFQWTNQKILNFSAQLAGEGQCTVTTVPTAGNMPKEEMQ